jgi:hypothetical protein
MMDLIKYIGIVSIGYGSVIAFSAIQNMTINKYFLTGFGVVVAISGAVMVVMDGKREEKDG